MDEKMSEPREWVIDDSYDLVAGPHPGKERITVVEKSAYDELKVELKKVRGEVVRLLMDQLSKEVHNQFHGEHSSVYKERDELRAQVEMANLAFKKLEHGYNEIGQLYKEAMADVERLRNERR